MPTHERQAIRDATIAALLGKTAAGARITKSRLPPQRLTELPAISVYTTEESVDPESMKTAPRELTRTVELAIEGWVAETEDAIDDALDALALEIETAMDADLNLPVGAVSTAAATAHNSVLTSTEIGLFEQGGRPMGCVRMVYSVVYLSDLRVADPTDTFDKATTAFNLGGAQATADQASDIVEDINQE